MVLVTHAFVGSAVASAFPSHPIAGFFLGFGSHFILDSFPHWDYELSSKKKNPKNKLDVDMELGGKFIFDLIKIAFDIGLFVLFIFALYFFKNPDPSIILALVLGGIGGVLPDFLQFVYFKIRREPLISIQKFHHFIHAGHRMIEGKERFLGIIIQGVIIAISLLFILYLSF